MEAQSEKVQDHTEARESPGMDTSHLFFLIVIIF